MQNNRIFIFSEPKTEYKDKLYRVPIWVMRIFLFLSFIFYGYHKGESYVNAFCYLLGDLPVSFTVALIIGQVISALLSLIVFEIVAKLYYGFLRPFSVYTKFSQEAFLVYLRASYVIRNILGGIIKLLVYRRDLDVFGYDSLINLATTVLVLSISCAYVIFKYVPIRARAGFLKAVSIPFIAYEIITLGLALL